MATQARIEDNLEKIPLKLATMLEEVVEFLRKKYSSESGGVWEELTTMKKLMDAFINQQEEELGRQRELFKNLMGKHKTLLKDLLDFSQKSEETEEKVTDLSDLIRSQAQTIQELTVKLASNEEKSEPTAAAAEEEEETQTQTFSASASRYSRFDDLLAFSTDEEDEESEPTAAAAEVEGETQTQNFSASTYSRFDDLVTFSTDEEDEEDEEAEVRGGDRQEESLSPQSSPCMVSFFGDDDDEVEEEEVVEEEDNQHIIISSDSESDTDNELALCEE